MNYHSFPHFSPCISPTQTHITCRLATNSFSSHLSHTALIHTSFPSCWKGLTTKRAGITRFALYLHSLNAFTRPWSHASLPTCLKPQHPHRYGIEGSCGLASSHSLCSQPQWCSLHADAVTHLTPPPGCWGTGCAPTPIEGGGYSNRYGGEVLNMQYDIQENSTEKGITNKRDQVIRQELECKKGVNILWQTEPHGWLNGIMDYSQDRYETRDEAVLDRKWIIDAPYKQSM